VSKPQPPWARGSHALFYLCVSIIDSRSIVHLLSVFFLTLDVSRAGRHSFFISIITTLPHCRRQCIDPARVKAQSIEGWRPLRPLGCRRLPRESKAVVAVLDERRLLRRRHGPRVEVPWALILLLCRHPVAVPNEMQRHHRHGPRVEVF
jgi:hypothetical protein